jgi:putative flippase GtrA
MTAPPRTLFALIRDLLSFAVISGSGLALDIAIYSALVYAAQVAPGCANAVSAFCAVTYVFLVFGRTRFAHAGFAWWRYLAWLAYQAASILAFSLLINLMVTHGIGALLAKGLTVPASFLTNYVFLNLLMRLGGSARPAPSPATP